jgi:hypothetical protein
VIARLIESAAEACKRSCGFCHAIEYRQPKDPPTRDAEQGQEVDKALGRAGLGLFGLAAGFQYLGEGRDLPAQRVPRKLLDRLGSGVALVASRDTAPFEAAGVAVINPSGREA